MAKPELKANNVPVEPGRYFMHRNPGFGSSPEFITVRESDSGELSYISDNGIEWQDFDNFWNLEGWLFSDKIDNA